MIHPGARYVPSPNFSSREGCEVECVVLHHISLPPGEFGGRWVEDFFLNRLDSEAHPYFCEIHQSCVSAHFLIDRQGALTQFVDTAEAAWHAGVSAWKGREGVNRFSVGIELEGDETSGYTEAQYETLGELLRALRAAHPAITAENVVGHEHVAPGRKRDPGPLFDWERARKALYWVEPRSDVSERRIAMTREEILAFLQSHPVFHLATVEGGEPRVRGMFLYRADGDGIVFHSGKMKDVHHQIEADPRVELCFNDNEKGVQVRVRGTLDIVEDRALMDEICEHPTRAFLKGWRDSAGSREMFYRNFAVYRMRGGKAVVWTMAENFAPKKWIDL